MKRLSYIPSRKTKIVQAVPQVVFDIDLVGSHSVGLQDTTYLLGNDLKVTKRNLPWQRWRIGNSQITGATSIPQTGSGQASKCKES